MNPPRRLLMVGDGAVIRGLQDRLFGEGFGVVFCADGTTARQHIEQFGLPHLLITNLDLPDMDGLALCRELQGMADLPIIVLASRDEPGLAARVLQYADDFLRPPVEPDELIMRIRRILSRIGNFSYASGPQLEICDHLVIDTYSRRVIVDGEERPLTPIENALLQVLLRHWGEVVDADTLMERVWRGEISIQDRNALRVHIHRLRQKIERDPEAPRVILTERGRGYVFNGC